MRVERFWNFGQFHKIHEIFYLPNLIPLRFYCQPNVQCTRLHKYFNSQSCVKAIGFTLTILLLQKVLTINKLKKSNAYLSASYSACAGMICDHFLTSCYINLLYKLHGNNLMIFQNITKNEILNSTKMTFRVITIFVSTFFTSVNWFC